MRKHAKWKKCDRQYQGWVPHRQLERTGNVIFLRAEGYMRRARTRREMEFIAHNGNLIDVFHAFPILESAFPVFMDHTPRRMKFHRVEVPAGWKVYAFDWEEVQKFVAELNDGGMFSFLFPKRTETPPQPIRFRRGHAAKLDWEWIRCWCGCENGAWEIRASIRHQAVISPEPIAYVREKRKEVKNSRVKM